MPRFPPRLNWTSFPRLLSSISGIAYYAVIILFSCLFSAQAVSTHLGSQGPRMATGAKKALTTILWQDWMNACVNEFAGQTASPPVTPGPACLEATFPDECFPVL